MEKSDFVFVWIIEEVSLGRIPVNGYDIIHKELLKYLIDEYFEFHIPGDYNGNTLKDAIVYQNDDIDGELDKIKGKYIHKFDMYELVARHHTSEQRQDYKYWREGSNLPEMTFKDAITKYKYNC